MIHKLKISRIVDCVILPLLVCLCLQLPMATNLCVFLLLGCTAFLSGSFSSSILRFWQAASLSASCLWIFGFVFERTFHHRLILVLVLFVWVVCCLITMRAGFEERLNREKLVTNVILIMSFLFVFLISPRNLLSQFGMIAQEDNQGWIGIILETQKSNTVNLAVPLGSEGAQFFVRFVLAFFSNLQNPDSGGSLAPMAVNVLANSWVILLLSSCVLVQIIAARFIVAVKDLIIIRLFLVSVAFCIFVFFRVSLYHGHFSHYLLNLVVFVFLCSIEGRSLRISRNNLWLRRSVSLAIAFCLVGSYNPWIVLTIVAVCVSVFGEVQVRQYWHLLSFRKLAMLIPFVLLLVYWSGSKLFSRYGGLHTGGGVWEIAAESIWLGIAIVILLTCLFVRSIFATDKTKINSSSQNNQLISSHWLSFSVVAILNFLMITRPDREYVRDPEMSDFLELSHYLALALLLGLIALPSSWNHLYQFFERSRKVTDIRNIFVLAIASFAFALFVWCLSRFSGPVFKPMYAAKKSMLSVMGQFFWIPLGVLYIVAQYKNWITKVVHGVIVTVLLVVCIGLLPLMNQVVMAKPLSEPPSLFSNVWWHAPVIDALDNDPNANVVCMNSDWKTADYSVYSCNRFMQSFTEFPEIAGGFRNLAWYTPDNYNILQKVFDDQLGKQNVVVLSENSLTQESKLIFRGVQPKFLKFIVSGS